MKRILLDTNIYGLITEKHERPEFKELMEKSDFKIYGCSVIRKELRDTPPKIKILTEEGLRNFRITLLMLYDKLTKDSEITVDSKTEQLADKYLKKFSEITGQTAINHLKNDFILVACATIHNLDLVVSEDDKTLTSHLALSAYQQINAEEGFKLPPIIKYEQLKKIIKRSLIV